MFLSDDQVVTLTGYKLPACQSKWLTLRGVRHTRNAAGRVILLQSSVEAMYGNVSVAPQPRFEALG